MDTIKERLESELNHTLERIRRTGSDIAFEQFPIAMVESGTFDDQIDAGCLSADREMSFAHRSLLLERTHRLAEALKHLDRGDYGICRECGEAIAPGRLRVMPEATTCVRCQERLERGVAAAGTQRDSRHRRPAARSVKKNRPAMLPPAA